MYSNILIPTDGDAPSVQAAVHGLNLAKWHNATVYLLYVVNEPPEGLQKSEGGLSEPGVTTSPIDTHALLEEIGTEVTDDFAASADELDVEAVTEVLEGEPSETIRTFAEEHDIDLIVMGTHGRSGVSRILEGSVTESVLRSTNTPVLVVQADEGEQPDE